MPRETSDFATKRAGAIAAMANTSRKETWLATIKTVDRLRLTAVDGRRSSTRRVTPRAARTGATTGGPGGRGTAVRTHDRSSTRQHQHQHKQTRRGGHPYLSGSGPRGADALRAAGRHRVPGVLNRRAHLGGRVHLGGPLHLHYHVSQPPRSVAAPCRSGAPGIDCRPPPHRAG